MPRKARRLGAKSALSDKVNNNELIVLDALTFAAPKTKEVLNILNNFQVGDAKVLFITEGDINVERSARNIQGALKLWLAKALTFSTFSITISSSLLKVQ